MRIAIIGGGISGLVAGYHLRRQHDVTLFEANDYIGGHTNTIDFELDGKPYSIDTGFIVFNDRTYPNFIRLLDELGVESQPTRMSFSVSSQATGLEYRGADWNGLFAQRRNLLNLKFYRLLWDLVRFNRVAAQLLDDDDESETVEQFFGRYHFSKTFIEQYFLPMGAAIWSAPFHTFRKFPIQFVVEFYHHHGLLGISNRPQWRVIKGGSKQYIKPLTKDWVDSIRLESPISKVVRVQNGVDVYLASGSAEHFDHVIFACHSDQALRILGDDATDVEREILAAFPYQPNVAVLHTQESLLPKNRRAWACWNYDNPKHESERATVTYYMNELQSLDAPHNFCVTLNETKRINPENIIKSINYSHPVFTLDRKRMQRRHQECIDQNSTSFCGAYWGNGFHEDGVKSALAVVERLMRTETAKLPEAMNA